MFQHTFYTWFIANLFHPLALGMYLSNGKLEFFAGPGLLAAWVLLVFYSLLFSLPCLFLSWGLLYIISLINDTPLVKFISWLFASAFLVALNMLLIIFLIDDRIEPKILLLALPGIASAWLAIIVRGKQFKNLILNHQTTDHEKNLV